MHDQRHKHDMTYKINLPRSKFDFEFCELFPTGTGVEHAIHIISTSRKVRFIDFLNFFSSSVSFFCVISQHREVVTVWRQASKCNDGQVLRSIMSIVVEPSSPYRRWKLWPKVSFGELNLLVEFIILIKILVTLFTFSWLYRFLPWFNINFIYDFHYIQTFILHMRVSMFRVLHVFIRAVVVFFSVSSPLSYCIARFSYLLHTKEKVECNL